MSTTICEQCTRRTEDAFNCNSCSIASMELQDVLETLQREGCVIIGNKPERSAVLFCQTTFEELATIKRGVLETNS